VAKCVYLCGQSETPPNSRISKASVGTDKWVPWQYASTAVEAIARIKDIQSHAVLANAAGLEGLKIKIVAIEQHPKAIDFRKANYGLPVAFVVGHETEGVSKEALKVCDEIVEIPMFGVNVSLNVMVSLAIVLYRAV